MLHVQNGTCSNSVHMKCVFAVCFADVVFALEFSRGCFKVRKIPKMRFLEGNNSAGGVATSGIIT